MRSLEKMTEFMLQIEALALEKGMEVKVDDTGVCLWPTLNEDGGLGDWFIMYIRCKP